MVENGVLDVVDEFQREGQLFNHFRSRFLSDVSSDCIAAEALQIQQLACGN